MEKTSKSGTLELPKATKSHPKTWKRMKNRGCRTTAERRIDFGPLLGAFWELFGSKKSTKNIEKSNSKNDTFLERFGIVFGAPRGGKTLRKPLFLQHILKVAIFQAEPVSEHFWTSKGSQKGAQSRAKSLQKSDRKLDRKLKRIWDTLDCERPSWSLADYIYIYIYRLDISIYIY